MEGKLGLKGNFEILIHAEFKLLFRDEELDHDVELTAALVNSGVDLKFFPEAPAERDAVNRVLVILSCSYLKPFPLILLFTILLTF